MSFYTYANVELEIRGLSKEQLDDELDNLNDSIERNWNRIHSLMAMTPTDQKDSDGIVIHWLDYVNEEFEEAKRNLEEDLIRKEMIELALEARANDPNSVHDDSDKWDEEKQTWDPLTVDDLK